MTLLSLSAADGGSAAVKHTWIWTQAFVSATLLMLNGFFSSIIARIRLVYILFVRQPSCVLSRRQIQWVFWQVVVIFMLLYMIIALVPALCFLYIYRPVCSSRWHDALLFQR